MDDVEQYFNPLCEWTGEPPKYKSRTTFDANGAMHTVRCDCESCQEACRQANGLAYLRAQLRRVFYRG